MKYKPGDVVYNSSKQEWIMIDDAWAAGYTGNNIPMYIDPLDIGSGPESSTQFVFVYDTQIDHEITALLGHVIVDRIKTYILGWNESMTEVEEVVRSKRG